MFPDLICQVVQLGEETMNRWQSGRLAECLAEAFANQALETRLIKDATVPGFWCR